MALWAWRHFLPGRDAAKAPDPDAPPPVRWAISGAERVDLAYMSDTEASLREAPPRAATAFLIACGGLLVVFVVWAYFAQLEEVTRGDGSVIPSSKTQIVQSLEGGIVKSIEAREGDTVTQGQLLLRIDDTGFASDLGALESKELALRAQTERLRAEAAGAPVEKMSFPPDLVAKAPDVVANEKVLFSIRRSTLDNQIEVLNERLAQRRQELAELRESRQRYRTSATATVSTSPRASLISRSPSPSAASYRCPS